MGLHSSGLGYSAINTAKSAVCSVVYLLYNIHYGNHILIKQFMKGIFNIKPVLPKNHCTWNVDVVLKYVSSLFPHEDISLLQLSGKLAVLLALTTGQRCQTLFYLDLHNVEIKDNYIKLRIGDLLKQSKINNHLNEIYIEKYPASEALCVVKTFLAYVSRTALIRQTSKVFISTQKPHNAVTISTISRWIKHILVRAGILPTHDYIYPTQY